MAAWIDGRQALAQVDQSISGVRQALARAIESSDTLASQRTELKRRQVVLFGRLAILKLDALQDTGDMRVAEQIDPRIDDLILAHERFVTEIEARVRTADETLTQLEAERTRVAGRLDEAIKTYESTVATTERSLKDSQRYRTLLAAHEEAKAVTARARQKLDIAAQDRLEKGKPYEDDPLFSYLWNRKFRQPEYDASGLIRMLDGWVARVCKYDRAYLNYNRLLELPTRLGEHVAKMDVAEAAALDALEAAEVAALSEAGADRLKAAADGIREELTAIDARIVVAEEALRTLTAEHERALIDESGPALEARRILSEKLQVLSVPDLRILAAQTTTLEDDRMVDELVQLRSEDLDVDLRAGQIAALPLQRRRDLDLLEVFRRGFKSARFDSPYAVIGTAALDAALQELLSSSTDPASVLRRLSSSVRQRETDVAPGFGGRGRTGTLGLPDIVEGVMWEIVREASRGRGRSGGFPFDIDVGSSPRRGSGISFPSPGRSSRPPVRPSGPFGGGGKRGGWRSGGGF